MSEHLHHKLELAHQNLLHGKLPRNLDWSDALELVAHFGRVQPHGGDEFAFVVGTRREFFKRPHNHSLGVEEVSRLRKLLKEAGPGSAPDDLAQPSRMVVVIDHHVARIYHDRDGSRPQDEMDIKPYDPHGFLRHLIHRKEAHYRGDRAPEETSFYEEVAKSLVLADEIVLIGSGTGKSSAVDYLTEYLRSHHPDIARRVTAIETADLSALTAPEVEVIAKRHIQRDGPGGVANPARE
jgi:hypothetical protein